MIDRSHFVKSALAATLLIGAACAKSDSSATDSAGGDAAAATPATTTDTGMAGMNHSAMGRPAAKDADQEFLRMMADHHEGMIQMATAAMTKGSNATVQGDAHKLHTKQADEQKQMVSMDQSAYGETLTPMVMPSNKAMMDALNAKTGADYDRTFYQNVIAHHREGIKMTDDLLPKLAKPELKQMAEKMKSDQAKEIAEFERKVK